jgi:hypothetical protein
MTQEVWITASVVSIAAVLGLLFLWGRMPVYRWSCRHCKKIVSTSRFHPVRCNCGENTLVASFCKRCGSWNTTPRPPRHCVACSSSELSLGAEYHFVTSRWRMRNPNPRRSHFREKTR